MTESEQIVYISCVKQVRYSFVSHLSEALRRKGINDVFIDSDDFLSNESQSKVERARVSVVVLSGNSTVCLDKLVNVLECQRNIDQVVVPVLYGEIPLQVEWDKALNSRGLSSVHQSRNKCTDSELVEEITRDVYEKLFYMEGIGIYSKRLEIENIVCKQPFGVRSVGIWGMPGIGKTTLAKAVFDQMSGEFDASCFIEDFDKVIHEKGVYRLLEEHFLKEKPGTDSTITKLSLLSNKLNNKRVLVVLDDLRNPLIAEPLLGGFHWFGPESLIIITSRDKQVLRLCRVNQIYEVQGLNKKEALQLFLLSASIKNKGEQNLKELSMKVIEYANGNPLALSLYGRELKGKKHLSEMETTFLKLKGDPPFKIVDAFKSSYESLNDREKNIFLDIACFFEGENVDYVMQLLEGCGFLPHVGIDVLVEKCLVTISENRVWMHNLIQDVGREIINKETVQIERRSRLWKPGNIKYLLEDNRGKKENGEPKTTSKRAKGLEQIEGIFLDTSNISFDAEPSAFENMLNLRLLKIYCSNPDIYPVINFPNGSLRYLPNELRLLHWENYPLQSLPQNFDPRHLVEINMPNSQLQKLWGETKNLEMLKTVRLCHSQQLVDISDLWEAQHLEVIDLQGCTRLQSFPNTGQLLHLRVLNLSHCIEIKTFPEVPPNIKTLHLQGTGIIALPLSTTLEPNHTELLNFLTEDPGLSDALKLERLRSLLISSSYCQVLGKLIRLDLKDCSRLQSLPNMVNLEFLEVLELSGCSKLETIQGFPQNLKELYIARTAVRQVPQLPQSLELFNAHGCLSLELIRLDSAKLLMHYTFSNCFNLSPQVINDFLVKVLVNAQHIPRERQQELNESPAFSFCVPSHGNQYSKLDLQPGSSVMTRLNPSWRGTLVGFAMLVEVAFLEDYYDATGFGIRCVCRWKNKEGHSRRIERILHCRALGKAVEKNHMFFFIDVNMRPTSIWYDLVVFEFFSINRQTKRLDDSCTVTRCGVREITAATGDTSLENILPVLSSQPMDFSAKEVEEVLRVSYDGLQEIYKALFLYIACLFNDEDVGLVTPLIVSIDLDVSSGLKVLADRSLISVSSNGEIVMHCLLRKMGKEILHTESLLPGSSKKIERSINAGKGEKRTCRDTFHVPTTDEAISDNLIEIRRGGISLLEGEKPETATPFGLEHRIKQVEEKLDLASWDETRIVGIVGMPGIGKTTLATELFNKYKYKFCRCVNFQNIREKWTVFGADRVRKMFLEKLLQIKIISDDEATHECLESKLLSNKVFVVLDDVSSKRQIEVLLGNLNWIKEGSRIVITTRDRTLITELDPNPYVVPRLNLGDGLMYFSFYAFEDHVCNPGMGDYLRMSREFVDYARGNPLALRVLGRDLRGKDEAQWRKQLDTLAKRPNKSIQDLLKVSYDELSEEEKDMFLDIACFFRSEDEFYVRSLLDSGDSESFQAAREITDLSDKFFISISGGRIEMHDLLHAFAMELCSLASCGVNQKKSRLWNGNYIIAALRGKMETKTVRGISLDVSEVTNMFLERSVFTNMCNLRYLKLYSSTCPLECEGECKLKFPDGLSFPLEEVRYLDWLKFPLEELPSDFTPMNLVDLRLPYSKIKQVWKVSKDTPKLKWVDLNNSRMVQTLSGFSNAPNLLRLNLEGCSSLVCLSEEMGTMESLVFLNLRGCTSLRHLPDINLSSLRTLILSGCSNLQEFRLISKNLENLYLDGTAIEDLPSDIVKLQRLILLNLKECRRLGSLPECIGKLKALKELILSGCSNLKSFPNVEENMENFRVLLLDGTSIEEVPKILRGNNSLSFLRRLSLSRNDVISSLGSDISQLYHLKWLDLKYCKKLRSLSTLPPNLQCLDAHGCISLETVTSPLAFLMPMEDIHSMFIFTNCCKLNDAAKNDIASHIRRKCQLISDDHHNGSFVFRALIGTCYPGYEVPPWFSHQAFDSVLERNLPPHWCDNKFLGLALCAIVSFHDYRDQNNRLLVKCTCEFENLDASCSRFSVPVGGWFEPGNEPRTVESDHVFIGYISWLNIKKLQEEEYKKGCVPTKAKLRFIVTEGTGEEIAQCEVVKCGFGLVYEPDDEVNNVVLSTRTSMNGEASTLISAEDVSDYPGETPTTAKSGLDYFKKG